jgi:hypothetical protein
MSDASVFRLYAEEAMRSAANAASEDERRILEELSCVWAQAALMSDRVFGQSFTSSQPDFGGAVPLSRAGSI